jgi:hypothetical protein
VDRGDGDEERVKLPEERRVRRQVRLELAPRGRVADVRRQRAVPGEHTADGGVGDEDGTAGRMEQDGIDRLGPEAGNRQHLPTERRQRLAAQGREASAEAGQEPSRERLEPSSARSIDSGRADDGRELGLADRGETIGTEQAASAQRRHRPRGARRRAALREHGSEGDLVGAPSRPPALRPEPPDQRHVRPQQPGLDGIRRWPRYAPPAEHA